MRLGLYIDLLLLYAACIVLIIYYVTGLPVAIGLVLGTGVHGALQRPHLSITSVSISAALFMLALAQLPYFVFSSWAFFAGLLGYGWFYWGDAPHTGRSASVAWRTSRFWHGLRRFYQHSVLTAVGLDDDAFAAASATAQLKRAETVPGPWHTATQALYVVHPHGVLTLGTILTLVAPDDPARLTVLVGAHWIVFALPVVREVALKLGCVSADRAVLTTLLLRGYSVAVVPEGTNAHTERLAPQRPPRNGFVALAYSTRVPVVLIETPAEVHTYTLWEPAALDRTRSRAMQGPLKYPFPSFFAARWPSVPLITVCAHVARPYANRPDPKGKKKERTVPQPETLEAFAARLLCIRSQVRAVAHEVTRLYDIDGWTRVRRAEAERAAADASDDSSSDDESSSSNSYMDDMEEDAHIENAAAATPHRMDQAPTA